MKKKPKVLDLFAGCGGFSCGLEMAGFEIVAAIDNWNDALKTFEKNHSSVKVLNIDLINPNASQLKNEIGEVDLVIGGPPCQGFSISGLRNPNDSRNDLYKGFVQIVKEFNPSAFVLENVPNLVSMDKGRIKDEIIKDFEKLGYSVNYKIMLASDFGVPQNRRRVFFVGLKGNEEFTFPKQTTAECRVSAFDASSDLPDKDLIDGFKIKTAAVSPFQKFARNPNSKIYNHQLTKHEQKAIDMIAMVPDGGNYKNLPLEFQNTRKVNIAWTRFNSKKPSPTIDTGHRHHFHYKFNRVPTVRESARLQSFPDRFIFTGSKTSQYRQVGNAVPPLLAKKIGEVLLEHKI